VLASDRSRSDSNGRRATLLEVCDELSTGWVWGGVCVTGALQYVHRREDLHIPRTHPPPMDIETANLLTALKALRDSCTNDQWDKLTESGPLAELIDACCDLEYAVEGE